MMAKEKRPGPMVDVLSDPNKKIRETRGTGGILAALFRGLLCSMNMNLAKWDAFVQDYLNDARNNVPATFEAHSNMRGNLQKEFSKDSLTWRKLCQAFRFLQFKHVEFTITATNRYGQKITQSVNLEIGDRIPLPNTISELDKLSLHWDGTNAKIFGEDDEEENEIDTLTGTGGKEQ